ncbi:MAG TPA: hypothetical protein VKC66_33250, partial [Xanthobacteraceae bacterium]|nr:hypothetical protein [Xanthobacteraceae bacterium]
RLDARLAQAKDNGAMKFLNAEYRRRRLAAREVGESFMPYRAAELRLRKALVGVAAGDRLARRARVLPAIGPLLARVARQTGGDRPMSAYRIR